MLNLDETIQTRDLARLGKRLHEMWEDQRAFNLLLRQPPKDEQELAEQARDFVVYTESEMHELLRTLPWKKHRNVSIPENKAHMHEEGIDTLKCVMSLLQIIGIETLDQLVDVYWSKTAVVRQRYREEWKTKIEDRCIIVDIDNVICDYIGGMILWLSENTHLSVATLNRLRNSRPYIDAEAVGVPNDLWQTWKHRFRTTGAKRHLPVFSEAVLFLQRMRMDGVQIVLLTSRPIDRYPNIFTDTVLCLDNNRVPYDYIWWSTDKGERILQMEGFRERVLFAIDDDKRYIDQFSSIGVPSFWLQRHGEQHREITPLITAINSLNEIHPFD